MIIFLTPIIIKEQDMSQSVQIMHEKITSSQDATQKVDMEAMARQYQIEQISRILEAGGSRHDAEDRFFGKQCSAPMPKI
jgi:hypothetical protein